MSCTGFSAPGFDFHLQKSLGLSPGLHRFHLGFMGCFAALPALKLAADICRSRPEARVLVVVLELCSVHLQFKPDREVMVANSLFADGAGAALVSAQRGEAEGSVFRLERFAARTIPESEQDMAWRLGTVAFDMRLSAYVPRLIERNIGAILEDLLAEAGLRRGDVALWAIHPGGRAILDRAAATLGLRPEDLWASYQVLRDYGNMSSATMLFVLELLLAAAGAGPDLRRGLRPRADRGERPVREAALSLWQPVRSRGPELDGPAGQRPACAWSAPCARWPGSTACSPGRGVCWRRTILEDIRRRPAALHPAGRGLPAGPTWRCGWPGARAVLEHHLPGP